MFKPEVSVIIPVYNGAEYIEEAINSVLGQEIPLEIIVIDDASTDHIEVVINKYIELDNFIYKKNNTNLGVAKSRNIGVDIARGDYIAFLDADDYWDRDKLKKQLEVINKHNVALVYTSRQIIMQDGSMTNKIIHVPKEVEYKRLLFHNCIPCSSVLLKKSLASRFPMKYDGYHEDYLNWLIILKENGIAFGIDEPLLKYRISKSGKSRNKLKSIRMTYGVYRVMGFNVLNSSILVISHIVHAAYKYVIG